MKNVQAQNHLSRQSISVSPGLNRGEALAGRRPSARRIGRRILTLLRVREDGSALVEVALTMPVLLMVVTGICTFAVGFNNQLTLTSAVGAGAQHLQLIRTTSSDPCADTLSAIQNAAPGLTPSKLTLSFNLNGTAVSGTSCAGSQANLQQGTPVTVSAKYPCTLAIYGTKFTTACQLSASATEYEY